VRLKYPVANLIEDPLPAFSSNFVVSMQSFKDLIIQSRVFIWHFKLITWFIPKIPIWIEGKIHVSKFLSDVKSFMFDDTNVSSKHLNLFTDFWFDKKVWKFDFASSKNLLSLPLYGWPPIKNHFESIANLK